MDALPGIGKDERSPEGYSYRGIEAIAKHLQPLLAKHGVIISPLSQFVSQHPSVAMKEGWTDVILDVEWRIYGPAGDFIDARTQGIGRDKSDKGAAKALTQARKNLLLSLFSIADKADDDDGQTYEHDRATVEPAASDETRNNLRIAIGTMTDDHKARVAAWFAEHKVPSLTKPGATLTQLNELADFITQLTTEPFEITPHREEGRALTSEELGDAGVIPATEPTATVSERLLSEPASPNDKPFNPVVAAREQLVATGSERRRAASAARMDLE